jgi:glycerol kinase
LLRNPQLQNSTCLGVGITNQRETCLLWDKKTGEPLARAIVWQDRRTATFCDQLREAGHEIDVQNKTGLLLDPYFSASKLAWLLDQNDPDRTRAKAGELAGGTIESWLIWKLTGGHHVTDMTNASRTSLLNIRSGQWDDDLLSLFNVPRQILPEVMDNVAEYGQLDAALFGFSAPIFAAMGDQQSASFGQRCVARGQMKSTYGTGCFALMNTGEELVLSQNRLLSTIAYSLSGARSYALEGSIFMAGAIVQWMRDNMQFFAHAADSEALAQAADPNSHVIMVPAFTGLGAPHWDPTARGTLLGMTRDTGVAEIVRAGLESVSLQTHDLLTALTADMGGRIENLRVDGGMVANNWFAQNLADITDLQVERGDMLETTALGAAYLTMLGAKIVARPEDLSAQATATRVFKPSMASADRQARLTLWASGVRKARHQLS